MTGRAENIIFGLGLLSAGLVSLGLCLAHFRAGRTFARGRVVTREQERWEFWFDICFYGAGSAAVTAVACLALADWIFRIDLISARSALTTGALVIGGTAASLNIGYTLWSVVGRGGRWAVEALQASRKRPPPHR